MDKINKIADKDNEIAEQMKKNGEFFEDTESLADEEIERDLVDMVKSNFPKQLFVMSVTNLLGNEWQKDGREILLQEAPELLGLFNKYVD